MADKIYEIQDAKYPVLVAHNGFRLSIYLLFELH